MNCVAIFFLVKVTTIAFAAIGGAIFSGKRSGIIHCVVWDL